MHVLRSLDLHEYLGGWNLCPAPGHPHPLTNETVPVIFGHEFSGVVEEVGEGVTACAPGDRVCILPILWDGTCNACQEGLVNCCERGGFLGLSGGGGGLAEHIVVPETGVVKLPEAVDMEVGGMLSTPSFSLLFPEYLPSPCQPAVSRLAPSPGPMRC